MACRHTGQPETHGRSNVVPRDREVGAFPIRRDIPSVKSGETHGGRSRRVPGRRWGLTPKALGAQPKAMPKPLSPKARAAIRFIAEPAANREQSSTAEQVPLTRAPSGDQAARESPAMLALVRDLARQAAREDLAAALIRRREQGEQGSVPTENGKPRRDA